MKFYLSNNLITIGGSSEIMNEDKEVVYNVKGKILTIADTKILKDIDGNVLYKIRNSFIHAPFLHSAFVKDAKGKKIMKVKEKVGVGYKIIYDEHEMDIEGKWFSSESKIIMDGNVLAVVRRKLAVFVDKFQVEVFDESNIELALALVVCMDNISDKRDE